MLTHAQIHPHDLGLPAAIIRKRRHARSIARWMLIVAGLTAGAGWLIYGRAFFFSIHRPDHVNQFSVLVAYALLITSSVTLILGLWYLLLAQVHRIARMVESDPLHPFELGGGSNTAGAGGGGDNQGMGGKCRNCGWPHDEPDRFCRHCGKSLAAGTAGVAAASATGSA